MKQAGSGAAASRERERERERERNMGERKRPDPRESGVQRSICFSSLNFSLVYIAVWRVGSAELQREHWQSDVLVQQGAGENAPTGTIAAVVVDRGMDRGRKTLVAPLVSFEKNEHNLNFEV